MGGQRFYRTAGRCIALRALGPALTRAVFATQSILRGGLVPSDLAARNASWHFGWSARFCCSMWSGRYWLDGSVGMTALFRSRGSQLPQ